jgi:hypothetical protein
MGKNDEPTISANRDLDACTGVARGSKIGSNNRSCSRERIAGNDETVSSKTIFRGWLQGDGFNRDQLDHGVDLTLKHTCLVQCTGGSLTYSECSLRSTNGDGLDAELKARGALAQKDATSYSVACAPPYEPDTTADRVLVRFG